MSDAFPRVRPCVDVTGRPREFSVTVEDGQVVVNAPTPGVARFHPGVVGTVRQDLLDAQAEAIRQRGRF